MKHFFKKNWFVLSVAAIVILAITLRFYKLGTVPHGMTWDEAAIGYNGFAIIHTRRDEWLTRLPVSFRSFGDYKAPLAIYINGVFTAVFGMNLTAVRLPFALASILTILGALLLTKELFKKSEYQKYYILFAGFLWTLSPWHLHYSRAGFESGLALMFFIWGVLFFLYSLQSRFKLWWFSLLSVMSFSAAIYAYHSSKVVVPLALLVLFILYFRTIVSKIFRVVFPVGLFLISLIPMFKDSFFGEGLTRAGVTIFSSDLSLYKKLTYVMRSYIEHLSPDFLLLAETTTLRHGTGYLGVLFFTTFILVTIGVIAILKNTKRTRAELFFLLLVPIGLLPASIALEVPHSNRALLALPGFMFTAIYGLDYLISSLKQIKLNSTVLGSHGETNIVVKATVGTILALHVIFSVSFISHYFSQFSQDSADAFTDGYIQAFEIAAQYEKGAGHPEVNQIIFTSDYGQPYIYALFVRETNPIWYQGGSLVKYSFFDNISVGDLSRENALIVGSKTDILPIEKADHIIYGSDGEVRFQMYYTGNGHK